MNHINRSTHHISKNQALILGAFLIILFFTVLAAWFVIAARTARVFDIKQAQLILNNDGCNLLRMKSIGTQASEFGFGCSVTLQFLKNPYGDGGVIIVDDSQVLIADDLVVGIGRVEDLPWTQMRTNAVILLVISTILLGLFVWIFVFILRKAKDANGGEQCQIK